MRHIQQDWLAFCQKVWQFIRKHGLFDEKQKVIVAVSGGIDSIILLEFFLWLRSTKKIEFAVAHVNHQLRGKESDGDEKFVRRVCEKNKIPFYSERVATKKTAKETKRSIQETARDLRYAFFDTLKKSLAADRIATAHNANDNAETMLMNLFRGSGIDGLSGIPVKRNTIVRPLLAVSRKEIVKIVRQRKLKFREDSSNLHDDYTRNYLRHKIIPKIEERINPSVIDAMLKTSEILERNIEFTDEVVKASTASLISGDEINIQQLNQLHPYIQQKIVHQLLVQKNIEPHFDAILSIVELKDAQKGTTIDIDKSFVAERINESILIRTRISAEPFEYQLKDEGTIAVDNFTFTLKKSAIPDNKIKNDSSIEYVDASHIQFPITVRSWKNGDVFIPFGMKGKKKLSDFFGEKKFSSEQKMNVPIIESAKKIVWIAGERLDDRFKLTDETTEAYQLTITFNGKKNSYSK